MAIHVAHDPDAAALAGPRLCLRAPRRADLTGLHEAIAETLPDLVRWLPWARAGHDRLDTRRYLRATRLAWTRRTTFEFMMTELDGGRIVGMTSLHRIDWSRRSAGLGYWVRGAAAGRGYATEAARLVAAHAFETLGLHRLELQVAAANRASHAVVAHLGARREGVARHAEIVGGRFLDHVQYSLLSTDASPERGA